MKTNNKGFSLVELIVVIAIMAILAAVAIPTFAGFIGKAQTANDVSFLNDLTYMAKVSNVAEHPNENVEAYVTVDANGQITGIGYTVGTVVVTVTKNATTGAFEATSTATATADQEADKAIAVEIANGLDWSYTFNCKVVKDGGLGSYIINPADSKELKKK